MADPQSETTKNQGDKLEQGVSDVIEKGSADPLEIPPPEEHPTGESTKFHGDKLEHHDKS